MYFLLNDELQKSQSTNYGKILTKMMEEGERTHKVTTPKTNSYPSLTAKKAFVKANQ
jgi:hypothetical protein